MTGRLIDADGLVNDLESYDRDLCDDYHMKDYVFDQIITDIKNQPTVDAIPVEWIKKYMSRCLAIEQDAIGEMVKEWAEREEE